jgi:Ca2+-transporting ATPase
MGQYALRVGLLIGFVSTGMGYWSWESVRSNWQTTLFTILTLSQMVHALAMHSSRKSIYNFVLMAKKVLLGAARLTFALQLAVINAPIMQVC